MPPETCACCYSSVVLSLHHRLIGAVAVVIGQPYCYKDADERFEYKFKLWAYSVVTLDFKSSEVDYVVYIVLKYE